MYKRKLAALDTLWATWIEFCHRAPPVLGFLSCVTYEEEKTLNQNPQIAHALQLKPRQFLDWMELTQKVEKERPLLGERLWNYFFLARAVIARIVFLLERDAGSPEMTSWRDDSGVRESLSILFTQTEISRIIETPIGAFVDLRRALDEKLLEMVAETRDALSRH